MTSVKFEMSSRYLTQVTNYTRQFNFNALKLTEEEAQSAPAAATLKLD